MPSPSEEYRLIPLTQGQFAKVDHKDYDRLSQWKWSAMWRRSTRSFVASRNAKLSDGRRGTVLMHRHLLRLEYHDVRQADHINRDSLYNRSCNLRIVLNAENSLNRGRHRDNTSGFKGVCFSKTKNKFRASIMVSGKWKHLGYRTTAISAFEELYVPAAQSLHGEFACYDS